MDKNRFIIFLSTMVPVLCGEGADFLQICSIGIVKGWGNSIGVVFIKPKKGGVITIARRFSSTGIDWVKKI